MRYYLDTEFIEDGRTIDLISIGLVAEDGREFYACSTEAQLHRADDWVRANVLPKLPPYGGAEWKKRADIRDELLRFLGYKLPGNATESALVQAFGVDPIAPPASKPELWAYFADYDWVAFCQLFGRMIDLPKGMPMFCMDLKQWAKQLGVDKSTAGWPVQESEQHDAIADARWNRQLHAFLTSVASGAQ